MSDLNIQMEGGTSIRLLTQGKYCDKNIVVTASGGGGEGGGSGEADHSAEDGLITKTLTNYTNSRVTEVDDYTFFNMPNLVYVSFPQATSVGFYTFYNNKKLVSVVLPNVQDIGTCCFQSCTALTVLDFPAATSIGNQTFRGCSALTTLILRNTSSVCTLGNTNSLAETPIASGTGYIYVPAALVDSYKAATNWSTYANQLRAIEDYPEITGG